MFDPSKETSWPEFLDYLIIFQKNYSLSAFMRLRILGPGWYTDFAFFFHSYIQVVEHLCPIVRNVRLKEHLLIKENLV